MNTDLITVALPFVIAIGMLIGVAIAGALVGPELPKNNDVAGAGYAIAGYATFAIGFVISLVTVVVNALRKRDPVERLAVRAALSFVAGFIIGILAWTNIPLGIVPILFLLIAAPIVLASSWPGTLM